MIVIEGPNHGLSPQKPMTKQMKSHFYLEQIPSSSRPQFTNQLSSHTHQFIDEMSYPEAATKFGCHLGENSGCRAAVKPTVTEVSALL
jgi:hypothetical protein